MAMVTAASEEDGLGGRWLGKKLGGYVGVYRIAKQCIVQTLLTLIAICLNVCYTIFH